MSLHEVLVVDDEAVNRFVLCKYLEQFEFLPIEAANGEEALNELKKRPMCNIVLLDLNMPVMDGYEFLQEINNSNALPDREIAIIINSASDEETFQKMCTTHKINTHNVVAYVQKPVSMPFVIEKLRAQTLKRLQYNNA
jgi:CheY-like chemotaxis protein